MNSFKGDEGKRLDIVAAESLGLSRSAVQKHIEAGHVRVNFQHMPKRYVLKAGDIVTCDIPEPEIYKAGPEPIPLDIVYEDGDVIVINKPQGMVVHPAPGHFCGTLVNALLYHCGDLSGVNGVLRPGIVHRLDKDTSGLIAVAKHDKAHRGLAAQLAEHTMGRIYNAVVRGVMKPDALTVDKNIGRHSADRKKMAVLPFGKGKTAVTHIKVMERFKAHTLIEARLETGRTHQIRVHLAHVGYPVFKDPLYGAKDPKTKGQMLHAKSLHFIHPMTGEKMSFDSPLPSYFTVFIEAQHHNRT